MKKRMFLICLLTGMVMATGLTGCIISTSPGTEDVIVMSPGETKVFKVNGLFLNTFTTKCEWYVYRNDGTVSTYEHTDHIEFTVNPEGEKTNRVSIICYFYIYYISHDPNVDPWLLIDSKFWNILIPRNTAPVWQGDYYIKLSDDLKYLQGYTDITGSLQIYLDRKMNSLAGLESLTSVGGDLIIGSSDALTSLSGLANITSVGGDLNIWGNDALTNLSGLENITSVSGELDIWDNAALTSLSGLENITSVGERLFIKGNDALTNLSGLENITSVSGELDIWYNDALTSLSSLENITSVGEDLYIWDNDALTSLSGLENITSIGGYLIIDNNNALTFLGMAALQRIDGYFSIKNNVLLCNFLVEELRDQVLAGGGIGGGVYIKNNKDCTTP
jgi:hypothetical protein